MTATLACPGPLIWRDVSADPTAGAILECAAEGCGYIVVTGGMNDERHSHTEVMREGLATS